VRRVPPPARSGSRRTRGGAPMRRLPSEPWQFRGLGWLAGKGSAWWRSSGSIRCADGSCCSRRMTARTLGWARRGPARRSSSPAGSATLDTAARQRPDLLGFALNHCSFGAIPYSDKLPARSIESATAAMAERARRRRQRTSRVALPTALRKRVVRVEASTIFQSSCRPPSICTIILCAPGNETWIRTANDALHAAPEIARAGVQGVDLDPHTPLAVRVTLHEGLLVGLPAALDHGPIPVSRRGRERPHR
jgi:hypothetical protein